MVQGTNFSPIPQGKGAKKNYALLQYINIQHIKNLLGACV
jgi:hypothetical protein